MSTIRSLELKIKKLKSIKNIDTDYNLLSPNQKKFLKRIFISFPDISTEDFEGCHSLISRTLEKNPKTKINIEKNLEIIYKNSIKPIQNLKKILSILTKSPLNLLNLKLLKKEF